MGDLYHTALRLIEPQYYSEFMKFTRTGEASKEFLDYININSGAQEAVEMIVEAQAEVLRNAGRLLREESKL